MREENWSLTLPLKDARRNDEVISIADSQILRWIDELNDITDADFIAKDIRLHIRRLRREANSAENIRKIRRLYDELDEIQFKPDYMCLIIDREKDYHRACRGFSINGIRYKRLLGTNGGIKNSTIVFVSERLVDELRRRIDNGRDMTKELVTAKLEAYKALTCSASNPVSFPNGLLVVPDAETEFLSDVIYLTDENDGEPTMELKKDFPIKMNASDGFGLMLPSLARRWSEELGLDYTACAMNTRFAFEKGVAFTFDFVDFAEKVAGRFHVKDAWGNDVDIRNVDLILTTSMVKLWDSYGSCEDYLEKSISNGYMFGISKTSPEELENERRLNYQFIQPYNLSDSDIDDLIDPTVTEINGVLGGDWRKTVLFLCGVGLNEENVSRVADDYVKAIMIDRRMMNDPYVSKRVYTQIRNRIDEAKRGVLKVHGNYSIVSGDPYLLCQSIFGLEKTGLLKAGEIYNEYWADSGADRLACFRAPMTCANNIRAVHPVRSKEARYWYRYLNASTVFNSWDTATMALNGCDFDGDILMLTDNPILVGRMKELPALMCAQRKASKGIPTEEDFVRSNIQSFGNEIGQTTNWITSMFEIRAGYPVDSEEYNILSYRIRCGQLYQQNAIDKAKGIVCKPMPKEWRDRWAAVLIEDEKKKELYRRIAVGRKPYFMRYVYPTLMKQYNTYIKNTDKNAMREFGLTVAELKAIPEEKLTEDQRLFLKYYNIYLPVGTNNCTMNRICRRIENEFDGHLRKRNAGSDFDYSILRSDAEYTQRQFDLIKRLYVNYCRRVSNYAVFAEREKIDKAEASLSLDFLKDEFERGCAIVCPDERALCNIVLDICYTHNASKQFAWDMCGKQIIHNLLERSGNRISLPVADPAGDVEFAGGRFSVITKEMEVE